MAQTHQNLLLHPSQKDQDFHEGAWHLNFSSSLAVDHMQTSFPHLRAPFIPRHHPKNSGHKHDSHSIPKTPQWCPIHMAPYRLHSTAHSLCNRLPTKLKLYCHFLLYNPSFVFIGEQALAPQTTFQLKKNFRLTYQSHYQQNQGVQLLRKKL